MNGECVRLKQGLYDCRKIYPLSPFKQAVFYAGLGFRRLHLVDLDRAASSDRCNMDIIRRICGIPGLSVDVGGGIRSERDVTGLLAAGADMITVSTMAVEDPGILKTCIGKYGALRFVLAADSRNGRISYRGWRENGPDDIFEFTRMFQRWGIRRVLCTDVLRDGMLCGPNFDLYRRFSVECRDLWLSAGGGVRSLKDIHDLGGAGVKEVIIGKAFLEGLLDPRLVSKPSRLQEK
jgi:phosphoribosylformimino-5-aminoimidazole carboxamide ribotide isomerase